MYLFQYIRINKLLLTHPVITVESRTPIDKCMELTDNPAHITNAFTCVLFIVLVGGPKFPFFLFALLSRQRFLGFRVQIAHERLNGGNKSQTRP